MPQGILKRVTSRIPFRVHPMLATLVAQAFDEPGWVFEEKYDGDRILAYKEGRRVRLLSRNGKDRTERFPRIAAAIESLTLGDPSSGRRGRRVRRQGHFPLPTTSARRR